MLHERSPWMLAHPIFFGRPFPWQWRGWRPPEGQQGPSPHLPTLSALLRDLVGGERARGVDLMCGTQSRLSGVT
jgi:hypothetical protein